MNRSRFQITLALLAVFLSGAVVGGFGVRLYLARTVEAVSKGRPSPEEFRRMYVGRLKDRLELDNEQVGRLHQILDTTHTAYEEVKTKYKPEMSRIHDEQVRQIRSMLSASQSSRYDEYLEERKKAREAGKH